MGFLLALQFLTRVPVRLAGPFGERDLARAMAWFPLVGLLLGAAAAGLHTALALALAPDICNLLALAFLVVITGNMHGDGLMDSADGLFSGRPREGMLEIMKDSRVGSHGVMAGLIVFLAKFVLLGQLAPAARIPALVLAPALGRWAQVYGASLYPYVRQGGGTGSFTTQVGRREIFWASLTVLGAGALLPGAAGWFLAGLVLPGTAALAWYVYKKIGGVTGDTLGAISECVEVLGLLALHLAFNL